MIMLSSFRYFTPWWAKILVKLFLSRFGPSYSFWSKVGLFKHGRMDDVSYSYGVVTNHLSILSPTLDLEGCKILEIGPGDFAASSLIVDSYGAKSTLLDSSFFVSDDIDHYLPLASRIGLSDSVIDSKFAASNFDEFLSNFNSSYLTRGLTSLKSIPSNSIDFVFSQAVLEHIPRDQFHDFFVEFARVLKPGSLSSHTIDLKDHLQYSLNNLRFPSWLWESSLFKSADFYTNRLRMSEIISIFESCGFACEVTSVNYWDVLPIKKNLLHRDFLSFDDQDLCVKDFDVVLTLV